MVVDRLTVGDRHQPPPQVVAVLEPRVRAQGGEERLLKAVVGVEAADGAPEDAQHLTAMAVEENLEGGEAGHHLN
jgi:hypothetical protein